MGNNSQINAIYNNMRPDAAESLLDSFFDNFYFENPHEELWDDMSPMTRMTILAEFLTDDGVNGDVVRDLFHTLNSTAGAKAWVSKYAYA